MAKILSQTGIETSNTVEAWHVTQSIDAFTGVEAYDITLSGSLVLQNGTQGPNKIAVSDAGGKISFTSGITASLHGTASYTSQALSASYASQALSASYASQALSASYASQALSSSYALTASYAISASYATTASHVNLVAGPNITINKVNDSFQISGSGGGGGGNPAGFNTQIQYNNNGNFGASFAFEFDPSTKSFTHGLDLSASGEYSYAAGNWTTASGKYSHAEGYLTSAQGDYSYAAGFWTSASGDFSHSEGSGTKAFGRFSHAEGMYTTASGTGSHAEGAFTEASGDHSHAEGARTIAYEDYQHVSGKWNNTTNPDQLFIIGNGTGNNTRSNAFRVSNSGQCFAAAGFTGTGADYAEYFESHNGQSIPVGTVVELTGSYIKPCENPDNAIGVISATPTVVGNTEDGTADEWVGKYEKDIWGRYIMEDYIPEHLYDIISGSSEYTGSFEAITRKRPKLNPNFDPNKPYIQRSERPEWNIVGLMGQIKVLKDQPINSRWIKMKDINDNIALYLVR